MSKNNLQIPDDNGNPALTMPLAKNPPTAETQAAAHEGHVQRTAALIAQIKAKLVSGIRYIRPDIKADDITVTPLDDGNVSVTLGGTGWVAKDLYTIHSTLTVNIPGFPLVSSGEMHFIIPTSLERVGELREEPFADMLAEYAGKKLDRIHDKIHAAVATTQPGLEPAAITVTPAASGVVEIGMADGVDRDRLASALSFATGSSIEIVGTKKLGGPLNQLFNMSTNMLAGGMQH